MPETNVKTAGNLSWDNLKRVVKGCSTNFLFYRELMWKPLSQAFKYLTVLVAMVAVVLGGREVYRLHRYLRLLTETLKGSLPPIWIEEGRVFLEGDSFLLEKENPYPARFLIKRIRSNSQAPAELKEQALAVLAETFEDPEAELTRSEVENRLRSREGGLESEVAALIQKDADFGRFIFQADLTGNVPVFSEGADGIILTRDTVYFRLGPARPLAFSLSNVESVVVNDDALERWYKLALWLGAPLIIISKFAFYYICRLVQIVFWGCLVAFLTAAVIKCRVSFRQAFVLSLYALTPVVFLGLVVDLLPIYIMYFGVVYLAVHAVYVAGATKNCCSL